MWDLRAGDMIVLTSGVRRLVTRAWTDRRRNLRCVDAFDVDTGKTIAWQSGAYDRKGKRLSC